MYCSTKVCSSDILLKYLGLSLKRRHSTQHSLTLAEEPSLKEVQQRAQQYSTQALVSEETRTHKKIHISPRRTWTGYLHTYCRATACLNLHIFNLAETAQEGL